MLHIQKALRSVPLVACIVALFPYALHAADDTFACLNELSGATRVLSGDLGYTTFRQGRVAAGSRFDARNAVWRNQTVPNKLNNTSQIILGGNWQAAPTGRLCWAGGTIIGTNDHNESWSKVKKERGAGITANSNSVVIDGMRIDNVGEDGLRVINSENWSIRNTWVSRIFDDCVENDRLRPGRLDDSLYDGCYVLISVDVGRTSNDFGQQNEIFTIDGLIARNERANMSDRSYPEFGPIFKTKTADSGAMKLRVYNSVFALEGYTDRTIRDQKAWERMVDCKSNIIAWLPDAPFPSHFPTPPSCFKIVKGKEARDLWNAAKQNWINCHPKVARAPGDPSSDFSKCDTSAYGGGGTETGVPG